MKKNPKAAGSTNGKGKKTANHTGRELSDDELAGVGGGKRTIVSGGVLNGKAISKPQPAYPPIA
jgi:hypothetical protein